MVVTITSRNQLRKTKRIIVKIGTSTLMSSNSFNSAVMGSIAEQVKELRQSGKEVVIVASGAIGLGMTSRLADSSDTLKQCFASIGQNMMMRHITDCFTLHSLDVSQILVNHKDLLGNESSHIKDMINALLEMEIIPVINQNDAISREEITKYDNDTLPPHVPNLIGAELLILLSDVDWLYRSDKTKEVIDFVEELSSDIYNCVNLSGSGLGRGGMKSKISAARIMKKHTVIANGASEEIISKIVSGEIIGTHLA